MAIIFYISRKFDIIYSLHTYYTYCELSIPQFAANLDLPRMFPFPKLNGKSGFYVILFFIRTAVGPAMKRMTKTSCFFILLLVEIAAVSADQGKSLLRYAMIQNTAVHYNSFHTIHFLLITTLYVRTNC